MRRGAPSKDEETKKTDDYSIADETPVNLPDLVGIELVKTTHVQSEKKKAKKPKREEVV